jgi:hypothetical protein
MGDKGLDLVRTAVNDRLGWLFREEARRDLGIDGTIEIVSGDQATGRLVAVQVKCGPSYLRRRTTDGSSFVYYARKSHLNYWLNHSLPVIVVLCNPASGECYWEEVRAGTLNQLRRGSVITVPAVQRLGPSAKDQLLRMAARPQRRDVLELIVLRYLIDTYDSRLTLVSNLGIPRDFHHCPLLIEIGGEGRFGVNFTDIGMGPIPLSTLHEELKWRRYNDRATGGGVTELMLFIIGDSVKAVRPSNDVLQLIEADGHVVVRYLEVKLVPFGTEGTWPSVVERTAAGEPIDRAMVEYFRTDAG